MLYAISRHVSSIDVCNYGCIILWNMSEGNSFIQEKACGKKGGLSFLLDALRKHNGNPNLVESCCGAIDAILSSQKTYTKYCTSNVLDLVRRCSEKYKDNEEIKQILLVLERKEDPRVRDAVSMGVCTKDAFPKCSEECECDENIYCPKCCVQQKAFWCLTCDKGEIEFYCETCIKRDHQGHECEEFFCPVRCGTK